MKKTHILKTNGKIVYLNNEKIVKAILIEEPQVVLIRTII